jgi:hypothetical protein
MTNAAKTHENVKLELSGFRESQGSSSLVKAHSYWKPPNCLSNMETRLKAIEVENVRSRLGFKNCSSVDCSLNGRDRAGGLSLMWMELTSISIYSFSEPYSWSVWWWGDRTSVGANRYLWFPRGTKQEEGMKIDMLSGFGGCLKLVMCGGLQWYLGSAG